METVENILWGIKNTKSYYDLAPINQYDYNLKLTFMKTLSNSLRLSKSENSISFFTFISAQIRIGMICILSSLSTSIPPI